ncbi:MAG TPA: citrate synthase [Candidatus Thiothrix moscowensis]|uniref:citrate synthase n=1 Tax=unclassified Thiothrix TaxID=2636184 RepID=UPI0025CCBDDA|nr:MULTISPECIES: citrate synthase [unclassified Thiothrix]HRJ54307.1 citrate synthase [Candidatus Thiothrix moscowensis]HRJ94618.1 citrate synthase [Candidatus Thiothrix moscowensis]
MTKQTVTLTDNATGKQIELDVLHPSVGPQCIDIRKLHKELGYFTYDPGFMSTASCSSQITYLDGDEGTLLYRGYPIEQLAEHSTFLEVCYLLLNGNLPNAMELADFEYIITRHTLLHDQVQGFYRGFRRDAHPMATMVGVVGALSAFYHDDLNIHDREQRKRSAHRLIAKMPTIAAWSYRYSMGLPFNYPQNRLKYAEDFLHLMFAVPTEPYVVDPLMAKALDVIMILHADHEQNASTSTVRLAGSSEANPFAAVSAGIASLWGPAHGGANEAVINMLREIEKSGQPLSHWIARAKDKNDRFRLMGFGHRVYKNYDPRAKIIRELANQILDRLPPGNPNQKLFDIARELEQVALNDDYFKARNLYPNVDFYSGVIFLSMGIPVSMFTVMFALARTIGWISQWNEMMGDEESRIGRPRQLYMGAERRDYVPVDKR